MKKVKVLIGVSVGREVHYPGAEIEVSDGDAALFISQNQVELIETSSKVEEVAVEESKSEEAPKPKAKAKTKKKK